jgi:hypothetical protein
VSEREREKERKSCEGGRVFGVLEGFCKNGDCNVACEGKGRLAAAAAAAVWNGVPQPDAFWI